jgi:hypothetical protein
MKILFRFRRVMKIYFGGIICLLTCTSYGTVSHSLLRQGCDELYTAHEKAILEQFSGLASRKQLLEYKEFMTRLKLEADLSFKITTFERSLSTDLLSILRTPLQRYSECRTSLSDARGQSYATIGPTRSQMMPCDDTYDVLVTNTINSLRGKTTFDAQKRFEDYLAVLKDREDLVFEIQEFEKRTPNVTAARLRLPLASYLNCRDSLIRYGVSNLHE